MQTMKEKLEELEDKSVKDRENWEHHLLIHIKYNGSIRDYLLSMGEFKDVEIKEDKGK